MAEDTERLKPAQARPGPRSAGHGRGGITLASALIGAIFFLVLAWNLPYWSLGKNYNLGMGGYLPLEALVLTLLLLLFNRFGASLALVVGLVAVAVFIPSWHGAVYVKAGESDAVGARRALYQACAGLIESARGAELPVLVLTGALLAFGTGALPAWLASAALPALRRRLVWRELLVVFVLVSVGTYSCWAVEWLVGVITVPYKDDSADRDFKRRFVRPVPFEQDPDNLGGIRRSWSRTTSTRSTPGRAAEEAGGGEGREGGAAEVPDGHQAGPPAGTTWPGSWRTWRSCTPVRGRPRLRRGAPAPRRGPGFRAADRSWAAFRGTSSLANLDALRQAASAVRTGGRGGLTPPPRPPAGHRHVRRTGRGDSGGHAGPREAGLHGALAGAAEPGGCRCWAWSCSSRCSWRSCSAGSGPTTRS